MYRYFENNLPNRWVYVKNTILCVVITVPKRLRFLKFTFHSRKNQILAQSHFVEREQTVAQIFETCSKMIDHVVNYEKTVMEILGIFFNSIVLSGYCESCNSLILSNDSPIRSV